tara:strand:+ start:998 stop:1450 length:453 start_codon:yes stop_codon:yes gene_type:complete
MKFIILIILILIDFFSKKFISSFIYLNDSVTILPFFKIVHFQNKGIAFGLFQNVLPPWLIILITIIIIIFLFYLLLSSLNQFEKWGIFFIISGALSNLLDRFINNFVLDFIYLHYNKVAWPAFNFADMYITTGLLLIIFCVIREAYKNRK